MTELPAPLTTEQLGWRCDPEQLGFETTAEVSPLDALFGQERGTEAIELALGLEADGYNLYVAGPVGTGRETAVRDRIARSAARKSPPPTGVICTTSRTPPVPSPSNSRRARGRRWPTTWMSSWRPVAGRFQPSSSASSTSSDAGS